METDFTIDLPPGATLVGRAWRPDCDGPSLIAVRDGAVFDISVPGTATMRDLLEAEDPAALVRDADGDMLGSVEELAAGAKAETGLRLLAPNDLQAVKACGVTFARSMVERVIEERAAGDPARAEAIRKEVGALIGDSLRNLVAGSDKAMQVKSALVEAGLWSQYLEVGIGPDAEVFSKAQPMSSVGWGARVGLHPVSAWNNPEPEVVLACDSRGRVKGATLGNDVNLRDVEGRSALLLGKAKDNNASAAIGPFIRLLDAGFGIDDVRDAELQLTVEGKDGYRLEGHSSMSEISRDPLDLVAQTCGPHHQYPDGFMLYLGTLFAPTQDRDVPGEGFTHKVGDVVTIRSEKFGALVNTVDLSTNCPPWTFGTGALMRNLAGRGLI
ncbi:fumarylacetoacetate hydrolase family protein [Ruegeria sediminis]|uniref:Fumarylacetoacetate hydrolase family protein n=1 Tax=Ruegeria sediminis TaxID=2583820 RepID=A0ABY2X3G8_9RHOB|nr:fumarylacetoacetate hydrolase family protein [Ruegeria sediminis]TMV09937.1 fumarylacetoacetate hydrolase family protein [Ruegeria sediminis]